LKKKFATLFITESYSILWAENKFDMIGDIKKTDESRSFFLKKYGVTPFQIKNKSEKIL